MMLGRIKVLFSAIALIVLMYSSHTLADEKYTANECFENFSRGTLKFNQGLDKAIFKPIAKGYRALPVPIRVGTSNVVGNLRSLLTLSNNVARQRNLNIKIFSTSCQFACCEKRPSQ